MSATRPEALRAKLPLLDRLLDLEPEQAVDRPMSAAQAMSILRRSVQRDLEALLNARRRWRSWPPHLAELPVSSVGYGIPDFASGVLNDPLQREKLRSEIEVTIRRFEPRFVRLRVVLIENADLQEPHLRLRIEALLRAEVADEPVAFETIVDTAAAAVTVRDQGERPDV
jgi:type VI secretion system protein ImpF